MAHYYYGGGRSLTLDEIGHLREVAEHYAWVTGDEGVFRRLSGQIADEARKSRAVRFSYDFRGSYDFGDIEFSHGSGSVFGMFSGTVVQHGRMLRISGESRFTFRDDFEDPLDVGIEAGGDPYEITGEWTASFSAEIFADREISDFIDPQRGG